MVYIYVLMSTVSDSKCTLISITISRHVFCRAITRSDCFHHKGIRGRCHASYIPYMSMFGLVQIVLSQIPEFGELWFLSVIAAVMSFLYSTIGLGLGIAKAVGENHILFHILITNHSFVE